ncbi:MAG TPA: DUF6335 family protein [Crinalium sp.]|jgi:hypothetical protein
MVNRAKQSQQNVDYDAVRRDAEADFQDEFGADAPIDPDAEELEPLESEIGMKEVYLDEAALDNIPADDTDDNFDADDDGVEDAADRQEQVSNLPQEFTESYGTGLQGQPSDRAGRYSRRNDPLFYNNPDPKLTGGDVDANYEEASVVGDEGVGGTVSTPDQDIVDELGAAVGLEMDDRTFLRTNDILEERDDRRWELDPKSSEDYSDRRE